MLATFGNPTIMFPIQEEGFLGMKLSLTASRSVIVSELVFDLFAFNGFARDTLKINSGHATF
jgi:hypothetical protein